MLRAPVWHPALWDWSRTATSLALAQRYSKLSSRDKALHDARAVFEPARTQRLMPGATQERLARPGWLEMAHGLLAEIE